MDINKCIATELLVLRVRKDKTINEVANALNIDSGTLSRYENSKVSITVEMLEKILNYYDENIINFFTRVSENIHEEKYE